jgi:hypothetical protein
MMTITMTHLAEEELEQYCLGQVSDEVCAVTRPSWTLPSASLTRISHRGCWQKAVLHGITEFPHNS